MAASPDIAPAPIGIPNRPAASASGGLGSLSRAAGSAVRRASSQFTGPSDWSIRMTSLRSIFDMSKIDLNEVMRMLQSDGPVNWELARRTALPAALDSEPSPPEADAAGLFGMPMGAGAMSGLAAMLAPVLLGVQAGSMVGYLARHALGRYDLPLPTSDPPNLCFVVANLDRFEAAWSLSREDLRFVVALHEVVRAAERSVPWLQPRLVALAVEYVSAYELDAGALESQLGGFDPTDPASMSGIAEHPEALLGAMRSPAQLETLGRIQAVTAVLEGYAELVVEGIGERLVGSYRQVHEALRRHRVERGEAGRFIEGLLGVALDRSHYEQGQAFCRGVC